MTQLPRDKSAL